MKTKFAGSLFLLLAVLGVGIWLLLNIKEVPASAIGACSLLGSSPLEVAGKLGVAISEWQFIEDSYGPATGTRPEYHHQYAIVPTPHVPDHPMPRFAVVSFFNRELYQIVLEFEDEITTGTYISYMQRWNDPQISRTRHSGCNIRWRQNPAGRVSGVSVHSVKIRTRLNNWLRHHS